MGGILAAARASPETVGFLTPHDGDVRTRGGTSQTSGTQDAETESAFEVSNNFKPILVSRMSAGCPVVGHIDEPHALEAEQLPVGGPGEFPPEDRTDRARLADEGRPGLHVGERQT